MRTINKVLKNKNDNTTLTEIVDHNGKTFRIVANIKNHSETLTASVMNSEGVFEFVLGLNDIDFIFTASYVSHQPKIVMELEKSVAELKNVIKKVYK